MNNAPRFQPGDPVVHVTSSAIPEGAKGTVLGPCSEYAAEKGYSWKVDYGIYGVWNSRDTSIELTREAALEKARKERG